MKKVEETYSEKMVDIDAKLDSIHQDLKRLMERSNKEYLDLMLTNLKKDLINMIEFYFFLPKFLCNYLDKITDNCFVQTFANSLFYKDF